MKKVVALICALVMLVAMLAGCASPTLEETVPETTVPTEPEPTEPPTEPPVEQEDPAADGVLTVLVIGNSFGTAWNDELTGMLDAAGIKTKIYSVYYAGCKVKEHWEWLEQGQGNYRLRHHYQKGGWEDFENATLEFCLSKENWDVISLQQHFAGSQAASYDASLNACNPYVENLYGYLRHNFPKSKLVWHQTWAYEVGWEGNGMAMDADYQLRCHENIRAISQLLASENGVPLIPAGDAWHIARTEYSYHDMAKDDLYHDGEEGGGQYLNACVWFEALTGQSCIGNEWRPRYYEVSEEKLLQLQEIAHRAWEENTYK